MGPTSCLWSSTAKRIKNFPFCYKNVSIDLLDPPLPAPAQVGPTNCEHQSLKHWRGGAARCSESTVLESFFRKCVVQD